MPVNPEYLKPRRLQLPVIPVAGSFTAAVLILLSTGMARASKDIVSGEAVLAMLVILALFLAMVVSNFVLSLTNISRKRPGVRIYNCIVTFILLLLAIPVLQLSIPTGLVILAGILVQGWLIYLGFPSKKHNHESYDL